MPLVTLYRCDAITENANKSANTYSKLQQVFNPANGLMNILMKAYQKLWNETSNLPLVDRMEYAMETSCTLKSIIRHHLHMKCGSGYDRTFPDVMMTFVFGWGKTNIQQVFRNEEMNAMNDEQLAAMRNDPAQAIFDYQVSSAERFKHVNNDMFMNAHRIPIRTVPSWFTSAASLQSGNATMRESRRPQEEAILDPARVQGLQQAVGISEAVEGLWRLDLE